MTVDQKEPPSFSNALITPLKLTMSDRTWRVNGQQSERNLSCGHEVSMTNWHVLAGERLEALWGCRLACEVEGLPGSQQDATRFNELGPNITGT